MQREMPKFVDKEQSSWVTLIFTSFWLIVHIALFYFSLHFYNLNRYCEMVGKMGKIKVYWGEKHNCKFFVDITSCSTLSK